MGDEKRKRPAISDAKVRSVQKPDGKDQPYALLNLSDLPGATATEKGKTE